MLPLPAGPLCSERCSVGILASTQSSSCLPSISSLLNVKTIPRGFAVQSVQWAHASGRAWGEVAAEFFGALEANAAF